MELCQTHKSDLMRLETTTLLTQRGMSREHIYLAEESNAFLGKIEMDGRMQEQRVFVQNIEMIVGCQPATSGGEATAFLLPNILYI
jgi:hypothetical protein